MDKLVSILVLALTVVISVMILEFIVRKLRGAASKVSKNQDVIISEARRAVEVVAALGDNRSDDRFYAMALSEVDSDAKDPSVWGRAFVDASGDEAKAKALYIKYRVKRMKSDTVEHKKTDKEEG